LEFLQYPLALILTLGILVTIHEYGHYVIARRSGVRILRFSVGFGRPIWSRVDRHGTEFAIAAIPLGGYVRMLDEREMAAGETLPAGALAHNQLTPAWRIAISLGGPVANFLLAIVVYWGLAAAGSSSVAPLLNAALPETPAAAADIQRGDEIVAVDGEPVQTWQEITLALANRMGESGQIELQLARNGGGQRAVSLPIDHWQQGVDEPDLLGSLGLSPSHPPVIGSVEPGSAAARAGLMPGDLILAVNDEPVALWREWVAAIVRAPGEPLALQVLRDGSTRSLTATPDERPAADGTSTGFMGVGISMREVRYGPLDALRQGVTQTVDTTVMTLSLLKKMVVGDVSLKNISGPLTIAEVAGDSARMGLTYFLGVLALLSVSLGVLNLLPIPILDGGHVVFAAAEWALGKPLPERVQLVGMQVGLMLVGGLMVMAIYNDIWRLLK
jgi:regulator of sigma E protease